MKNLITVGLIVLSATSLSGCVVDTYGYQGSYGYVSDPYADQVTIFQDGPNYYHHNHYPDSRQWGHRDFHDMHSGFGGRGDNNHEQPHAGHDGGHDGGGHAGGGHGGGGGHR